MNFVLRLLISAGVIFGVAYLSGQTLISVDEFWPTAVLAALVLGLANAVVKPVVHVLSLPVTILTLGLFALVVNALMLYIVAWVVPGFETTGFFMTVIASIIIAALSSLGSKLIDRD